MLVAEEGDKAMDVESIWNDLKEGVSKAAVVFLLRHKKDIDIRIGWMTTIHRCMQFCVN